MKWPPMLFFADRMLDLCAVRAKENIFRRSFFSGVLRQKVVCLSKCACPSLARPKNTSYMYTGHSNPSRLVLSLRCPVSPCTIRPLLAAKSMFVPGRWFPRPAVLNTNTLLSYLCYIPTWVSAQASQSFLAEGPLAREPLLEALTSHLAAVCPPPPTLPSSFLHGVFDITTPTSYIWSGSLEKSGVLKT